MYLLFPGRHVLLTTFQFGYLHRLVQDGPAGMPDAAGRRLGDACGPVEAVVFAVTSANHHHTRRNPVPFHLRVAQIEHFARHLPVPAYVYGIDEVGVLDNFAAYTLKCIRHESDGHLALTPLNTLVVCSTPVMAMYEALGFRILPAELADRAAQTFAADLPWSLVERIARTPGEWHADPHLLERMHPASVEVWRRYRIGDTVRMLFRDTLLGDDGDITATRDYNSYVRQMDEIADLKFAETAPYIRPGRIGDIGCAVGSWIRLACREPLLRESDFYGIEVARHLAEICQQRKHNGEFANPCVFFAQKNAVTGLVFEPRSMHTLHTSSLTHEIESYGSRADLLAFIQNRHAELAPGGVWINRDVAAPHQPGLEVVMELAADDGRNTDWHRDPPARTDLAQYLDGLSTAARFRRFARDFRHAEGGAFPYRWEEESGPRPRVRLALGHALEFALKKDYTDNWASEMHETFCFWTYADWVREMEAAGFRVLPSSHAYCNEWIVRHRLAGKVALYPTGVPEAVPLPWPVTHLLLVAEKREV